MQAKTLAKSFIIAASLVAAGNVQAATNSTIATYGSYLGMEDGHAAVAKIALAADGHFVVTKTLLGQPEITSTFASNLAPETLAALKTKIEALSTAEIKTTQSQIVCMMMPIWGNTDMALSVARNYDYSTDTFHGALTVVDNNAGCWAHTHIAPKETYDQQTANELEAQLQVLATQAAAQ